MYVNIHGALRAALLFCVSLTFGTAKAQNSQMSADEAEKATHNWVGTDISAIASASADDDKTLYLYNVGKKLFAGRGGHWGTELVISEVGVPFMASKAGNLSSSAYYKLATKTKAEGTTTTGYFYLVSTGSGWDRYNYFTDDSNGANVYFESVSSTNSSDKRTMYRIYSYLSSSVAATSGTKCYMRAAKQSTDTGKYSGTSGTGSTSDNDNPINAFTSNYTVDNDSLDVWILVTQTERKQMLENMAGQDEARVPAHSLVLDNDFARNDQNIVNWNFDGTALGVSAVTATVASPSSCKSGSTKIYIGNGWSESEYATSTGAGKPQHEYGSYWTANIFGNNHTLSYTIPSASMIRKGWYEVQCQAFTTSKVDSAAYLYVQADSHPLSAVSSRHSERVFIGHEDGPTDQTSTFAFITAGKLVQDEFTATGEQTQSYTYSTSSSATKTVTDNINVSRLSHNYRVRVYIDEDENETIESLSFGVKVANADDDTWTCVDNVELYYLGENIDKVILDEDQTDIKYMNDQNIERTRERLSEVYIHRTLKVNKWNSLILPINLSRADLEDKFGKDVKLSKFVGADDPANPNCVNFYTTKDSLKADHLYLIKPSELNTYTVPEGGVTSTKGKDNADNLISLDENTSNVFFIDALYYGLDSTYQAKVDAKGISNYKANVSGGWGKASVTDKEAGVHFVGTYTSQQGIVKVGDYYISDDKWKYHKTLTQNSKGFRAWLTEQSSDGNTGNAKALSVAIDGVDATAETTGIEDVLYKDGESMLNGRNHIYTVGGQLVRMNATSTDGLPAGLYIVGGKKISVK